MGWYTDIYNINFITRRKEYVTDYVIEWIAQFAPLEGPLIRQLCSQAMGRIEVSKYVEKDTG